MPSMVLDVSLRAVAAAAAVGVVLAVFRVRSGAARHAAWSAVLVAMLAMPVLTAIVPRVEVPVPSPLVFEPGLDVVPQRTIVTSVPDVAAGPSAAAPAAVGAREWPARGGDAVSAAAVDWRRWAAVIYAAGLLAFVGRLAAGWSLSRRIRRGATPVTLPDGGAALETPTVAAPMITGVLSPAIVLPATWRGWPEDTRRAVLAHEQAHIARRDSAVSLLAQVNRVVFWFHPLSWWLERTLAATAEYACDEAAARTVGDDRRYAEILVGMAEAVRRQGSRVAWPAVGVGGSGLLGVRIDRILRGSMTDMSLPRRAATAVACLAALALVIACRQQLTAAPLREDPAITERLVAQAAAAKRFEAARDLSPQQADALEARLVNDPNDWDARQQLVTYYRMSKTVSWDKKVPGLRRHALWLIEHHPEHEIEPPPLSPQYDPAGFAAAVRLWDAQLRRPGVSPFLVYRAGSFFSYYDKPRAEQLFLRGIAMDPESAAVKSRLPPNVGGYRWKQRLGWLYASALTGTTDSVFNNLNSGLVSSEFALEVRKKLDGSTDAVLLTEVGGALVRPPRGNGEVAALARSYVERAVQLDRDLAAARYRLYYLDSRERAYRTSEAERRGRDVEDRDRLWYLATKAEFALIGARSADYYQKSSTAGDKGRADARTFATEALKLAADRKDDPWYSNAVMTARQTLAGLEAHEGNRDKAIRLLTESLEVPSSEALTYSPPSTWHLAVNQLLTLGERERVVSFLEAFARVSPREQTVALESAQAIREGRMPMPYQYATTRQAASGEN